MADEKLPEGLFYPYQLFIHWLMRFMFLLPILLFFCNDALGLHKTEPVEWLLVPICILLVLEIYVARILKRIKEAYLNGVTVTATVVEKKLSGRGNHNLMLVWYQIDGNVIESSQFVAGEVYVRTHIGSKLEIRVHPKARKLWVPAYPDGQHTTIDRPAT